MVSLVAVGVVLLLLFLIARNHPRLISADRQTDLTLRQNDDFSKAWDKVHQCEKYVASPYTTRVKNLLMMFLESHKDSFEADKSVDETRRLYKTRRTALKALLHVRYRMPQDAKLLRDLSDATEEIDYAMRMRIKDAEARNKSIGGTMPLGHYDYAKYFRAFNDTYELNRVTIT